VERQRLRIKDALLSIEMEIRRSPLNIAMVSTLSHGEFSISDPLKNELTKKRHATPKEAAENMATFSMACIVQAGYTHFDTTLLHLPTKMVTKKIRKGATSSKAEEASDDGEEEIMERYDDDLESLVTSLKDLANNNRIPQLDDLYAFLKKAFSSLNQNDHLFLQSILLDLYVLQQWTRPWDYRELQSLRTLHLQQNKKVVDITDEADEYDEYSGLGLQDFSFSKVALSSARGKQPVSQRTQKAVTATSSVSPGSGLNNITVLATPVGTHGNAVGRGQSSTSKTSTVRSERSASNTPASATKQVLNQSTRKGTCL